MEKKTKRRDFLTRVGATVAVTGALAGCTTGSGSPETRTTEEHTTISASPENGKLKFVNNTDDAVCSLELENAVTGNTIEILDLPQTHDKLKPHYKFTYASADYSEIDESATYHLTATTCDDGKSATNRDFSFARGGVWTINEW